MAEPTPPEYDPVYYGGKYVGDELRDNPWYTPFSRTPLGWPIAAVGMIADAVRGGTGAERNEKDWKQQREIPAQQEALRALQESQGNIDQAISRLTPEAIMGMGGLEKARDYLGGPLQTLKPGEEMVRNGQTVHFNAPNMNVSAGGTGIGRDQYGRGYQVNNQNFARYKGTAGGDLYDVTNGAIQRNVLNPTPFSPNASTPMRYDAVPGLGVLDRSSGAVDTTRVPPLKSGAPSKPTFRNDPNGNIVMWDEARGEFVPAPGSDKKDQTGGFNAPTIVGEWEIHRDRDSKSTQVGKDVDRAVYSQQAVDEISDLYEVVKQNPNLGGARGMVEGAVSRAKDAVMGFADIVATIQKKPNQQAISELNNYMTDDLIDPAVKDTLGKLLYAPPNARAEVAVKTAASATLFARALADNGRVTEAGWKYAYNLLDPQSGISGPERIAGIKWMLDVAKGTRDRSITKLRGDPGVIIKPVGSTPAPAPEPGAESVQPEPGVDERAGAPIRTGSMPDDAAPWFEQPQSRAGRPQMADPYGVQPQGGDTTIRLDTFTQAQVKLFDSASASFEAKMGRPPTKSELEKIKRSVLTISNEQAPSINER